MQGIQPSELMQHVYGCTAARQLAYIIEIDSNSKAIQEWKLQLTAAGNAV